MYVMIFIDDTNMVLIKRKAFHLDQSFLAAVTLPLVEDVLRTH
jgi:hypothetical protein